MRLRILGLILLATAVCRSSANAQATVPILSGGVGFLSSTSSGNTSLQPTIEPLLVVPVGGRWLIESRAYLVEAVSSANGTGSYRGQFSATLGYAQVDFLATHWLTITAGRFLTPFNMFNERLAPIWIDKFEDAPLIFSIGTTQGSSDGGMLRGSLVSHPAYQVAYTAYFSALSTVNKLASQRSTGARASIFFPNQRLEVGGSYGRLLQGQEMNFEGAFLSWQPYAAPLDVKAEYAHSPRGQGYWVQAGYRMAKQDGPVAGIGRLEVLGRVQQFERLETGSGDGLPGVNTQRFDLGADYRFPHEIRLTGSYGRQFVSGSRARNVWEFGVTYRFLFPLYPGGSH